MLTDRLHSLSTALQHVENRLDQLEQSQTGTLGLHKRCTILYAKQEAILQRLAVLDGELSQTHNNQTVHKSAHVHKEAPNSTEARLSQQLHAQGIKSYQFKRVPGDYYDQDLNYRCNCLQAASIQHLCKSLILENTRLPEDQCGNTAQNSRYYLVIVQYAAKFHGEKLKRYIHKLNGKLGIQYFRLTFAAPDVSEQLSGYAHGSVTPVGIKTSIPIILSHKVTKLVPNFLWMGGGEEDLKLGMTVDDFVHAYSPLIVDCTY